MFIRLYVQFVYGRHIKKGTLNRTVFKYERMLQTHVGSREVGKQCLSAQKREEK